MCREIQSVPRLHHPGSGIRSELHLSRDYDDEVIEVMLMPAILHPRRIGIQFTRQSFLLKHRPQLFLRWLGALAPRDNIYYLLGQLRPFLTMELCWMIPAGTVPAVCCLYSFRGIAHSVPRIG